MAQQPCVFRQQGGSVYVDYTPGSAVTAGDVILQGTLVGIVPTDLAASQKGSLNVLGVWNVPKDSSNLSAVGTAVYWDADGSPVDGTALSGCFTSTATANTFAGWCLETAGAGVGDVDILLVSSFAVSVTTTDALTDVGTVDYTAGDLLIADGSKWECVPLSGPFTLSAAGLLAMASATVAVGGTAQANANAVAAGFTLVSGADNTAAIKLPAAAAGAVCVVKNVSTTALLKVFPGTGDKINGGSANAVYNQAIGAQRIYVAYDATDWYTEIEVSS